MESKKNSNDEKSFGWFEKVEGIVESFLRGLAGGFAEKVRERVREIVLKIQKNIAGFFLVMIGFVFSLIGVANFINDMVKMSDGIGYALVGLFVILAGLIIIKR